MRSKKFGMGLWSYEEFQKPIKAIPRAILAPRESVSFLDAPPGGPSKMTLIANQAAS